MWSNFGSAEKKFVIKRALAFNAVKGGAKQAPITLRGRVVSET
jgi:hypothetical protein